MRVSACICTCEGEGMLVRNLNTLILCVFGVPFIYFLFVFEMYTSSAYQKKGVL